MIAAGIGCRRACALEDVLAVVRVALERVGRGLDDVDAFYAPMIRADSPALRGAAAQLCKRLEFVAQERLLEQSAGALTRSERVLRALGVPSIAETAALAGAARPGRSARLLGPRVSFGGATCALAVLEES
jgi:cobalt-precorrin 5A hydrolase